RHDAPPLYFLFCTLLLQRSLLLFYYNDSHLGNLHLAPFSISGFGRRLAPPKPAPFAGARSAPANGARSEVNYSSFEIRTEYRSQKTTGF
ncbi:MAG TPA: hypothetical protein V6C78_30615, partial [Crinalium sp.]